MNINLKKTAPVSDSKLLCISEEHKREFTQGLLETNITREKLLSVLLIIVNLVLLLIDGIVSDCWTKDIHIFSRFSIYHIMLFIVPSFYFVTDYMGKKVDKMNILYFRIKHLILNSAILMICSLIAVHNATINKQLFPYMVAVFCIASLLYHKKTEMFIIFIPSYLIYVIGLVFTYHNFETVVGNITFVTLLVVLAMIVSCINFTTYTKSFIDSKTIFDKKNELKDLSALLQATFDSIPDIITVKNTENDLLHYNRAAYHYFFPDSENMIGRKCYELLGKSIECENCATSEVLKTRQPVQMERYIEPKGRWMDVRAYPILDEYNNIVKIIEHNRDITIQKKVEIELQQSNSILKAQQEASMDGILITDGQRQILSHNQRFVGLWNFPDHIMMENDEKGLLGYAMQCVENAEGFIKRVIELYASPMESSREKLYLKNGMILDRYSAPILLAQGKVFGRVWYFRDITEKEITDEALRETAKENEKLLREALKYDEKKNEFFTNISHEFRTPINVLLSTLQLMNLHNANTKESEIGEKNQKHITIMKQNCYRLLRLTNNLIDMTRLDMGFFEINLKNCNIVQVVEDITLSVAEYVENKGCQLVFDTDIEEKIMAVDADKIERIVLNLLSNAVKFTKCCGIIRVSVLDKGDNIEISVMDTGIGIPQDKLRMIFERFGQVNSSLSRSNEGSGIGLSLVKNLVELHAGNVRVNSEIDKGTEFVVELPCRLVCEDSAAMPADLNTQSHVERISIEFSDIYSL
jgi:PAS domain S-box-containing protein